MNVDERIEFRAEGDVHGVGYRQFCRDAALRLDLTGYAKNEEDGSVTVVVEGNSGRIAEFKKYLDGNRPGLARVDNLRIVSKGQATGATGFRIL